MALGLPRLTERSEKMGHREKSRAWFHRRAETRGYRIVLGKKGAPTEGERDGKAQARPVFAVPDGYCAGKAPESLPDRLRFGWLGLAHFVTNHHVGCLRFA